MPPVPTTRLLAPLDWIVIAAYIVGVLVVGWYYSRKTTSSEDYLLGGRHMKWYSLGISLFATMLSAVTYLAVPGETILHGPIFVLGKMAAYPLVAFIVGWWLIPRIMEFEVTSAYEILELKLGLSVRMLGSVFFLSLRLMWMALVVYATAAKVLVPILGIDAAATPWICMLLGAVTVAYTSMGGLRAVVVTDVLQSVILFGGALLTVGMITWHFGGIGGWWPDSWPTHWESPKWGYDPNPMTRTFLGAFIATIVWFVCTQGSDQMVVQRFLSNRDIKTARKTLFMAMAASALTGTLLTLVGLAVWAFFRSNSPEITDPALLLGKADKLFPEFVMTSLPSGISGLVIAGLLAVAMSSLSSGVNSACSVIKVDFIDRLRSPQSDGARNDVRQMFWISIAVGLIVVVLSSGVGSVQDNLLEVTFKVCNLLTAPLFGLFFMAMFVRGATVFATHIGAVCGLSVIVLINCFEELTGRSGINFLWAMPLGLAVQITIGVALSRCFPKQNIHTGMCVVGTAHHTHEHPTASRTTYRCSVPDFHKQQS